MRYRFFKNENKREIICVSSYAKKPVRGYARCAEGDEFNEELGKDLAQVRCDMKIAQKRINKRYQDYEIAKNESLKATENLTRTWDLYCEAVREVYDLQERLESIERKCNL